MDHNDIIKRLKDHGFSVHLIGGCVRDMLLGDAPDDYDIVTSARPYEILNVFSDCNTKEVGRSFGVILVEGYEVATYRFDNYYGHKTTVSYANTLVEDMSRRDLTINGMAYSDNGVVDLFGGQQDLKDRVIRFIGDPEERIKEDPNRMIRACRFLSRIDGVFEDRTFLAILNSDLKSKIAPERIRVEILKAMKTKRASVFFEALYETGLLSGIFPSLCPCFGHYHGVHHIENIFNHCMLTGNSITTKDPVLKLTGYLHDVGKPITYSNGKFIGHEIAGANLLGDELKALKFSNDEVDRVCGLVRSHMNNIKGMKPKGVRKLLRKFHERGVDVKDFLRLRIADRRANIAKKPFTLSECKNLYKKLSDNSAEELSFTPHDLAVSGGDIIKELDIEPGPMVSYIQGYLLDDVLENGINEYNYLLERAEECYEYSR